MASENWTLGQNDRTGKTGLVPTACLYTIPTVTKPSAQLMVTHMLIYSQPRHLWAHEDEALLLAQGLIPHLVESQEVTWALGLLCRPCHPSGVTTSLAQYLCTDLHSAWHFTDAPTTVCPGNKPTLSPLSALIKPDPWGPRSPYPQTTHPSP